MGKTYLCGKIGKSVKFNPKTWTGLGGDCETPELLRKMAELHPDDTFIIIGKNDLPKHREELNLPKNLISIYETCTKEEKDNIYFVWEQLKDKQIDGCFLVAGPTAGCCNIPNKVWRRKELANGEKVYAKSLYCFENYVAPMYIYLNESNIPWVLIANDPRYIHQSNDLINQPKKILSQFDETILMKQLNNFEEQKYIKNKIESVYAGVEKIFLIDKEIHSKFNKTEKFMIVLNEGNNGAKSRYPMIKEYVLDYIDDVEIYGKWNPKTIGDDTRFKGTMDFHELQQKLDDVKYSFIVSIKDGWVTMKIWELISHGVIPFLHPNYDSQKHCKVTEFLRVEKPEDLHKRIEYLEKNPDKYELVLNACLALITEGDITGKTLSNTIMNTMNEIKKENK